jgi:predicted short-subunit dehydrogenase-like oxidoreductase (DUF2520 family)
MASKRAASKKRAPGRRIDDSSGGEGRSGAGRNLKGGHVRQRAATVSIVGAGRLGTALGLALAACGYTVEALAAKRKSSARRARALFRPPLPLALSSAELHKLPASDILLIATPDDLIRETARRIQTETARTNVPRTALHTSGALSSQELNSLRESGFRVGSLHPLVAVSHPLAGMESLRRAFFCLEGERAAMSVAKSMVEALGARFFSVPSREKALYHAAAVTASGHMVALFDIAAEMLANCGLRAKDARAILLPLLRSTVDNLSGQRPERALTGTFARADVATVRRHLEAIGRRASGEALAVYRLLGAHSLKLAARNGVDEALLKEIARELKTKEG